MGIPSHLVNAKIAELRARGAFVHPQTDEARVLAEIERLLGELARAEGTQEALMLRARLAVHEQALAHIFERTGQSVLADALWEDVPEYDA